MILSQKPAQSMEKLRLPSKKTVKRSIVNYAKTIFVEKYSHIIDGVSLATEPHLFLFNICRYYSHCFVIPSMILTRNNYDQMTEVQYEEHNTRERFHDIFDFYHKILLV